MPTALIFLLIAAGLAFLAFPGGALARPGEQGKELKRIESQSHQDRIRILQEADRCIGQAKNRQQYRACEEAEADARRESNARAKAAKQALRVER